MENTTFLSEGGSFKSYMDYRTITDISSNQYKLIHSDQISVGSDGLLYTDDGYVGVALGSAFGEVGDKFIIQTSTQQTIKVIKLDEKSDNDTIDGIYHSTDGSVVEFVVDTNIILETYHMSYIMGDFNHEDKFSGNVISVTKVTR